MNIEALLATLPEKGIQLWTDNGELRFSAPKNALTPELRNQLVAHKAEAILFLAPLGKIAPVSFSQQRLWLLAQLEPLSPAYNIPVAFRLGGSLDIEALAWSLRTIVGRHDALRTAFLSLAGQPIQVITPLPEIPISITDLRSIPDGQRPDHLTTEINRLAQEPFDLQHAPLFRFSLFRLAEQEHVLLLNFHHIVFDGWSMGVFYRELKTLYEARITGQDSPLPPLSRQYSDYAVWQRGFLQGEELHKQLDYWKQHLGDPSLSLDLPTDYPRPAVQSDHGAHYSLELSAALSTALRGLARQTGTTLFMTVMTAFQVWLHRCTAQADIRVGIPIANRNQLGAEGLVGFFVNTLVMRSSLPAQLPFKQLLHQVQESALDAYAHQDLPFEKLVEELHPERNLAQTPLFQAFFNMVNVGQEALSLAQLNITSIPITEATAKFDITLYAWERDDRILLDLLYRTDLFSSERSAEMMAQLQGLLEQVAADPDRPIAEYSLLTPQAAAGLPDPTQALDNSWEGALSAQFSRQAQRLGTKIAVADPQEQWTYAELEARSNQLAHFLRQHGIHNQDVVAIYAHRSASLVWALLGTLKAGAAFVLLDADYPAGRLADCLKIAAPRAWLQLSAAGVLPQPLAERVAAIPCRLELPVRSLADRQAGLQAYPTGAPGVEIGPDDLAYVAFTSGTTGQPRGILGTHRPLSHFIAWHRRTFGLGEEDRFSMFSGLSHDPLLRDIFTPLTLGASLHIPPAGRAEAGDQLAAWLRQQEISVVHLTPALGQLLASGEKQPLSSLRYAFFGGDILTRGDVEQLSALAPSVKCVNFYGATETPQAMGYCPADTAAAHKATLPVGKGIQDVQLLVLNGARQLAGVGELGEIYIRTPYLSRGYANDTQATQERFLPNPWAPAADAADRLYRTGDLGRYLPDGQVEFAGRADGQVKLRGYRVELSEIEAALERHSGVAQAIVLLREDQPGSRRLVGYVVPKEGTQLEGNALRAFLKESLPEYMLPSAWVVLEHLPLTPNGKVDRKALPAPERSSAPGTHFVAPHTPTEIALAQLWAEVLGLEQVGAQDNFFDIGGHSLLATRVLARIHTTLGVNLPLRKIFEAPVLRDLALEIQAAQGQEATSLEAVAPPILPVDPTAPLPLSFAQERLWFLDQLDPGATTYHITEAKHLSGRLDLPVLEKSLDEIVRRHQSLRTTFSSANGQPVQIIHPYQPLHFSSDGQGTHSGRKFIDLSTFPLAGRQAEAERLVREETLRPFDLAVGPLMRTTLIRLNEEEHILVFTLHHIISDGWSHGILIHELTTLYEAFQQNRPSPLPELAIQYADFAVWQRQWLQGEVFQTHIEHWKQRLTDVAVLQLPSDHPRSAALTHPVSMLYTMLPEDLVQAIKQLGRREGVTLFMVLLAAFKVLLYRYSGQKDICVGTFTANRNRLELESLIGFFINNLALRSDLSGNPDVHQLLQRVSEVTLEAYAHQDLPFEKVLEAVQPKRSLSHTPLFQVMCVMQNFPISVYNLPGLAFNALETRSTESDFDLTLWLYESPQGLSAAFGYNRDLFEADTIERMSGHFQGLLRSMAANPEQHIADLELLTPPERHQLLETWNQVAAGEPAPARLHELFTAQARQTPEALAVKFGEETLSYAELERRSSLLAQRLVSLGVGPGSLVALYLERSVEVVVAFLGVLKAGGAYIPLDPRYPRERLAFMLADAGARILITQQRLVNELPAHHARVLCLEALPWNEAASLGMGSAPAARPAEEDLAYVIYTSGSTGQPKGVRVTHGSLMSYLSAVTPCLNLHAQDRVLQFASYSFDATTEELYPALLCGASVVLRPEQIVVPDAEFMRLLKDEAVTVLSLPVAFWHEWVHELSRTQTGIPAEVRMLLLNAEEPSAEKFALWQKLGGERIRWINTYGPTETTVTATLFEPGPAEKARPWNKLPIGRPLANTRVYVLDATRQPVPIGVPGELYLGGAGVTDGYLNRPDLTAQRFVPDPFSALPGKRLYRTGDRVRYLPDGNLEFLERVDFQVKIRGYRIELGEIEAWLSQQAAVREAAVLVREDGHGQKVLVAYLVPEAGQGGEGKTTPVAQRLRQAMKASLPDYMIPAAFVELAALPLNPNGKVDRQALQALEYTLAEPGEAFVPPSTPFEEILAEIWGEVLKLEQVGVQNNFFDLGGHSLLAMQVLARVRDRFEIDLPVRHVFEAPTIAELALRVEQVLIEDIRATQSDDVFQE